MKCWLRQKYWISQAQSSQPLIYTILIILYIIIWYHISIRDIKYSIPDFKLGNAWRKIALTGFTVIPIIAIGFIMAGVLESHPVNPLKSDIIPSIEMYTNRVLTGEEVYKPLKMPSWTIIPTYLPMMWLPYLIPELLGIDYRVFSMIIFGASIIFWSIVNGSYKNNSLYSIFLTSLPFLALLLLLIEDPGLFAHTVELAIVGYYILLCVTIKSNRPVLIALGIIICLLSRYSFTFWLPSFIGALSAK